MKSNGWQRLRKNCKDLKLRGLFKNRIDTHKVYYLVVIEKK